MKTIVYAATDITFIEIDSAKFWNPPATFVQSGKTYRRLTPEYWAWFNHKYHVMEQALINRKISEQTFEAILERISKLYLCAYEQFGKAALDEAVRTTDINKIDGLIKNRSIVKDDNAKHKNSIPRLVVQRGG